MVYFCFIRADSDVVAYLKKNFCHFYVGSFFERVMNYIACVFNSIFCCIAKLCELVIILLEFHLSYKLLNIPIHIYVNSEIYTEKIVCLRLLKLYTVACN